MHQALKELIEDYNIRLGVLSKKSEYSVKAAYAIEKIKNLCVKIELQNNNPNLINEFNSFIENINFSIKDKFNISFENQDELNNFLVETAKPCNDLLDQFKEDLKNCIKENGITLTHTSKVAPELLTDNKLLTSKNIENMYLTTITNGLFASTEELNRNRQLARCGNGGLVAIKNYLFLPNGNNISIENDKLKLNEDVYVYHLNCDDFDPQVTITHNKENGFEFRFDNEWICPHDVDIYDKNQVSEIEPINDITPLLDNYEIVVRKDESFRMREINERTFEDIAHSEYFEIYNDKINCNSNDDDLTEL